MLDTVQKKVAVVLATLGLSGLIVVVSSDGCLVKTAEVPAVKVPAEVAPVIETAEGEPELQ